MKPLPPREDGKTELWKVELSDRTCWDFFAPFWSVEQSAYGVTVYDRRHSDSDYIITIPWHRIRRVIHSVVPLGLGDGDVSARRSEAWPR